MKKRIINQDQTLDELLHSLLNEALVAVSAPAGSLMKIDDSEKTLHIKSRLGPPRKYRTDEPIFRLSDKKGIACKVVREKKAYFSNNVTNDNNFNKIRDTSEFKSLLSVPIILNSHVFGVINADSIKENHFSDEDIIKVNNIIDNYSQILSDRITFTQALASFSRPTALNCSALA